MLQGKDPGPAEGKRNEGSQDDPDGDEIAVAVIFLSSTLFIGNQNLSILL